jgi:glycine betaine/proline transport system substrate-binding protein
MTMHKMLLATVATVALQGVAIKAYAADVTIGVPSWSHAQTIANIIEAVLADELGIDIAMVPGTNPVLFEAMDKGSVDVHPDVWMPNQKDLVNKYVNERGTVLLSENGYTGSAATCVTKATAEKTGVKSIYDLGDPEIARLFDTDGDGKGEIWAGAAGWASTTIEQVRFKSFGISETFEVLVMEEELGIARLRAAQLSGEPLATMCVIPHAMWKIADLVVLEEPEYDESKWNMIQPTEDPDWLEKAHVEVAWPEMNVQLAYAKRLETDQAAAAEILSRISFQTEEISDFIFQATELKRDPADIAGDWMKANPDRIRGWQGL